MFSFVRLRWSNIDREEATWTLPGEFTKSGREHKVALLPFALSVLDALPRMASDYVFSSAVICVLKEGDVEQ